MPSYIYSWNPKKWNWADQDECIDCVSSGEPFERYWSCGNTKKISIGDRFVLIKLGEEPKGIIGCGYVTSDTYELPHWDEEKASEGRNALRTDIAFIALQKEPILTQEQLKKLFPEYNWSPQVGGLSIPENITDYIFESFSTSIKKTTIEYKTSEEVIKYFEGQSKTITTKSYDRNPRARKICLNHHGFSCNVCGFEFEKAYGELGSEFIEVHHLKMISSIKEEYEIDPIQDLRPVCSNCHRMLHRKNPPLSIDELKYIFHSNK